MVCMVGNEYVYFVKAFHWCDGRWADVVETARNPVLKNVGIPGDTPEVAFVSNLSIFITCCKEHFNS